MVVPVGLALLVGCSSAPPPAPKAAPPPPKPEAIDPGPTSMESDVGGMNEEAVEAAFTSLQRPLQDCLEQGFSRVNELGGHLKLAIRVDKRGETRWAYLSESTLGDRETEKCVLDVARNKTWPKPVGGEGLAQKTFDLDPRVEPVPWQEHKIRGALKHAANDVARCRRGIEGRFTATAYVRPDGHVLSAGVSPPSEKGEEASDCLVDAIRRLKFGSPGGKPAKVTFSL